MPLYTSQLCSLIFSHLTWQNVKSELRAAWQCFKLQSLLQLAISTKHLKLDEDEYHCVGCVVRNFSGEEIMIVTWKTKQLHKSSSVSCPRPSQFLPSVWGRTYIHTHTYHRICSSTHSHTLAWDKMSKPATRKGALAANKHHLKHALNEELSQYTLLQAFEWNTPGAHRDLGGHCLFSRAWLPFSQDWWLWFNREMVLWSDPCFGRDGYAFPLAVEICFVNLTSGLQGITASWLPPPTKGGSQESTGCE